MSRNITCWLLIAALMGNTAPSAARRLAENDDPSQKTSALNRVRQYTVTEGAGCGTDALLASYSQVAVEGGCSLLCDAYTTHADSSTAGLRCNAYVEAADGTCLLYSACSSMIANEKNSTVGISSIAADDVYSAGFSLAHSGDVFYVDISAAECAAVADLGVFEVDSVDCRGICNVVPQCSAYSVSGAECKLHSTCTPMNSETSVQVVGLNIMGDGSSSATSGRDGEQPVLASSAAFTYLHRFHCSDKNIGQVMLDEDCAGSPELCTAECADVCSDWDGCIAFMLKESGKCKFYDKCTVKAVTTNDYVGVMDQ